MLSIIVPAYNSAATIEKCLESLLSQDYAGEREIIIVDDGSTDQTPRIASRFPVTLLRQEMRGPAAARNRGASEARGSLLLFIDADCVAGNGWLREMVSPFTDPAIAGVQGVYRTAQRELAARFAQMEIEHRYRRMKSRPSINFIGTYSAAYRKAVFEEHGGFHEGFAAASGEDPDLSFRIAEKRKLVLNPRAVVYHQHPDSLARYLKQKFNRAYWRVLLYRRHTGKIISESYTPQTLKLQILLLALGLLSLLTAPFLPTLLLALAVLTLLVLSTIPESWKNFRRDKSVGLVSPGFLILRTAVFVIGLLAGAFNTRHATGHRRATS